MSSAPCFPLLDFLVTPVVVGFERHKGLGYGVAAELYAFLLFLVYVKGHNIGRDWNYCVSIRVLDVTGTRTGTRKSKKYLKVALVPTCLV